MTASSAFPTIILLALAIIACPESPRFLMGKDHYAEAYETLTRLRGSRILAAKELLYTHYQMNVELTMSRPAKQGDVLESRTGDQAENHDSDDNEDLVHLSFDEKRPNFLQKLWQLFTIPRIRNATLTAVTCMVGQQLCGANVLIFYSSNLFASTIGAHCDVNTDNLLEPLLMSWGIGLVNFIFAFPAYWLIDRKGRRWLLMTTLPFLLLLMGAAAMSYINGAHNAIIGVFAYLFMAVYSWGMGPVSLVSPGQDSFNLHLLWQVPFTISAEVFPLDHRVAGMSFAVFTNLFGAGLLTLFVPAVTGSSLGHGGLLGICTFLNLVALVLVFCFVRETVGAVDRDNPGSITALALEELYKVFNVPAKGFLAHQLQVVVPYWKHRFYWLLSGRKGKGPIPPDPLYRWWEKTNAIELRNVARRGPSEDVNHEH